MQSTELCRLTGRPTSEREYWRKEENGHAPVDSSPGFAQCDRGRPRRSEERLGAGRRRVVTELRVSPGKGDPTPGGR